MPAGEPGLVWANADLPAGWRTDEVITRELGDRWISDGNALALRVPSIPIAIEDNVLINPEHPGMAGLRVDPPLPFIFDTRMFRVTP